VTFIRNRPLLWTTRTLRTSAKKPTAEDELEELELDSFISDKKKSRDFYNEDEQEPQTLNKRDYGNFTLLVVLCKNDKIKPNFY
jgi:hypothetical protein